MEITEISTQKTNVQLKKEKQTMGLENQIADAQLVSELRYSHYPHKRDVFGVFLSTNINIFQTIFGLFSCALTNKPSLIRLIYNCEIIVGFK